jgi:hypothetical protein
MSIDNHYDNSTNNLIKYTFTLIIKIDNHNIQMLNANLNYITW